MKLPKYVKLASAKHRTLTYQRRLPKDVAALTGKSMYSQPLGLRPPPECTPAELAAAVERATFTFDAKVKQVRNSDTAAFSDREIDLLAADILRRGKLRAGEFAGPYESDDAEVGAWDRAESATGAEGDDELTHNGRVPTAEDKARQVAMLALLDAERAPKHRLLSELFALYLSEHPKEGKALRDAQRSWQGAMSFIGDRFATTDALPQLHHGLDEWVESRLQQVTPATVQRGLNDVLPVLRWAARKYRIDGWHIVPPQLPLYEAKTKLPFTQEQQRKLVELCLEKSDGKAAVMLMMLQGGMMPSEVARLDVGATLESLSADNPHVLIGYGSAKTKTDSRKRIVPVVVQLELIRERLVEGIRWADSVAGGSASAAINKRLASAGFEQTSHSFRHTLSQNIKAAHISPLHGAQIAGWKAESGIPEHMLHYGAEGVSEYLEPLTQASRLIHRHLLDDAERSNVVPMRSRI